MFALCISNSALAWVPPKVISELPDGGDLSLDVARQLASTFLEDYARNNNLTGRAVARARIAAGQLEPGHYIELDTLRIELRNTTLLLQ